MKLHAVVHPTSAGRRQYGALVGIDDLKQQLLDALLLLLDCDRLTRWQEACHPRGLRLIDLIARQTPLILLSGEVGCGKTALAGAVATPLAERLDAQVVCLETPSDIRGTGLVGELSSRITAAFEQARSRLREHRYGVLIIDEGDDLATSREQNQAHHEDRAGVNVLIKQLDQLARDQVPLAVILITNRAGALDPAILRRAALQLRFRRPDEAQRRQLLSLMLEGCDVSERELASLARESAREPVRYSSSDLLQRVGRLVLLEAWQQDEPVTAARVREALRRIDPSPLVE